MKKSEFVVVVIREYEEKFNSIPENLYLDVISNIEKWYFGNFTIEECVDKLDNWMFG